MPTWRKTYRGHCKRPPAVERGRASRGSSWHNTCCSLNKYGPTTPTRTICRSSFTRSKANQGMGLPSFPAFNASFQCKHRRRGSSSLGAALGPTPRSFNNSKSLTGPIASPTLDFLCGLPFLASGFLCEWARDLPFSETRCRIRWKKGWWLVIDNWWLMIDDWWLRIEDWGLMVYGWWLMVDDWWLMIDDWWLMIDDWWLMIDGWWLMIDDWWLMIDKNFHNRSWATYSLHGRPVKLAKCLRNTGFGNNLECPTFLWKRS